MLKNFVQHSDLKRYYPTLDNNLWKSTLDFSNQIDLAFEKLEGDLLGRNIDTRKVMIPYQLANAVAVTTTYTGSWFTVPSNYVRFFVKTTNSTSGVDNQFVLQGTNDKTVINDIETLIVNTNGDTNIQIDEVYKYYRVVVTGTSLTATAELYETAFDGAIAQGAFIYIFRDFMKEVGDVWDIRRQFAEADYDSSLNSLKFYFDNNDNQNPADDEVKESLNITFTR